MNNNENQHDFSKEVQSAIYDAIGPYLEKLKAVETAQNELDNRIKKYAASKAKTEQDILDLQTSIINGNNDEKIDEVTALKLKLQSMDDIVKGIKENRLNLSNEHEKILEKIGYQTNVAFTSIKVKIQEIFNEEATQFLKQFEDKYLALKTNLSPCSFVSELQGVSIKTLNTYNHFPGLLKFPDTYRKWIF